jgi:hypothetical protein
MIHNLKTHNDNQAEMMRIVRNRLLSDSDWAMATDAPTDKTAWAAYRQELRDFPATWKPAETADFPEAPK